MVTSLLCSLPCAASCYQSHTETMNGDGGSLPKWLWKIACLSLLLRFSSGQGFGPPEAEITTLPLWDDDLPSPQYGGYIVIPGTSRYIYYTLVVSENEPAIDPLIVSIPGGPGESSTGGATGPFLFNNQSHAAVGNASIILVPSICLCHRFM
ncbi:hypothetical protein WJX84_001506 [Apatococcus fuscideae]|uniref:Uncharacterized protein n=1 Tax=Apatococcus fuscideae TaxID=2026836 RepID=A0AAW1RLG1_9CHLO